MSHNFTTALRRTLATTGLSIYQSRAGDSVRLNRSLILKGFRAAYASSSSIPITKTNLDVAELLSKANSPEERKEIFDKIQGTEQARHMLPPTPHGPSGVHLTPIGRTKLTTQRTGIDVHHSPFEALVEIYQQTLKVLEGIPPSTVYRQSVESFTRDNLEIIQKLNDQPGKNPHQIDQSIQTAEKELGVEMIETAIEQAQDELQLSLKMIDFRAWQELEDKAPTGQWDYFQVPPSTSYPKN